MAIRCHSAFKHYEMFHGNSACGSGGFTVNNTSIFNVGCNGGHSTNFWGGLGMGFGLGLGNMFGNMFGGFNFGNMFGGFGFGMGNMFGGFGLNGLSGLFGGGSKSSKSSSEHTCKCNCSNSNNDSKADKDSPVMERLTKAVSKLEKQKEAKKELDQDEVAKLRKELKELVEKPKDDLFENSNKFTYQQLLNKLNTICPEETEESQSEGQREEVDNTQNPQNQQDTPPVEQSQDPVTQPQTVQNPQQPTDHPPVEHPDNWVTEFNPSIAAIPDGVPANIPGYTNVTSDDVKTLSDNNLNLAKDLSRKTRDVINNNGAKVSTQKYADTEFPLYLQITDRKTYNYKCIGTDANGRAYYATPNSDSNKNVYILAKKGDDFVLIQVNKNFSGFGLGDKQS